MRYTHIPKNLLTFPLLLVLTVTSAFAGQQGEIYRQAKSATVLIVGIDNKEDSVSLGSGFFLRRDGLVLTNAHVIEGSKKLFVYVQDQIIVSDPEVLVIDADADLAILRIPFLVEPLRLAVARPDEGAQTIAVGYPRLTDILNMGLTLHSTVVPFTVNGLVQGQSRLKGLPTMFLQSVGNMYGGGSGGPLIDAHTGEVVAVMTQTVPYLERVTARQGKAAGSVMMHAAIAYSIPASVVREWMVERNILLPVGNAPRPVLFSKDKDPQTRANLSLATAHLLHTLAFALSNESDLLALAVKHYRSALQLGPKTPWALCNLGLALASLEQWTEAIEMFQQSLAVDPKYSIAAHHLDTALQAERRRDEEVTTGESFLIHESVAGPIAPLPVTVNLTAENDKK
jgi:trypsin-like peptidase/tetratricopeptide repeat protein